jgi:dolichol-phosphate mannosyltransferase
MKKKLLSVLIPMFSEEEVVAECYKRVKAVLRLVDDVDHEILFIDDGSRDHTLERLKAIRTSDDTVRVIRFSRNFGHQAAVTAGLERVRGDATIILDADLQDPPELIPQLIEKWRSGFHVVYAVRRKRKEGFFKRVSYAAFYRLLKRLADVDIPLDSGDFCLMDRVVVDQLNQMPERNRFIRGLRSWIGFSQTGIEYERDRRFAGEVKYTLPKLIKLGLDGLLSFSYTPLRLATFLGFITSSVSFVGGIGVIISKYIADYTPRGWTSTLVIVFFLGGVQLITLGIIGEYIGRIYDEVKKRPVYIVEEDLDNRYTRPAS